MIDYPCRNLSKNVKNRGREMRKILLGLMICMTLITCVGLVGCGTTTTPPPSGITEPDESNPDNTLPNIPPEEQQEPTEPETPSVPEKTLSEEIMEEIEILLKDRHGVITEIEVERTTKTEAIFVLRSEDFFSEEVGYMEEDLEWIFEEVFAEMEDITYTYEALEETIRLKVEKTELV